MYWLFQHSTADYFPDPNTLIGALYDKGISVQDLSCSPEIDLREQCNIWLSKQIQDAKLPIHRIGCIEMTPYDIDRCQQSNYEAQIISSIQAYFHMLHIASLSDIDYRNNCFADSWIRKSEN